ncbi:hypothetical protein FOA52_008214 [Chlamydomonas sp. UWO 241]|nr:hypothetical protein FOA52_008214 [Chlamydomonas sp. UWO 241]
MTRILGSKWTAMQETLGWRHFRVAEQRNRTAGLVFLLMQASCDPSAQLWVNSTLLKDRSKWGMGWLQMADIPGHPGLSRPDPGAAGGDSDGGGGAGGSGRGARPCRTCNQSGCIPCITCEGSGVAMIDI